VDTATNILFDTLTVNSGTASPYDMRFTNTLNFEVTNSLTSGHAALRFLITNSTPAQIASPPAFSPPGGLYPGAQSVTLSTPTAAAAIRYTTDGTTPSSTNGTLASGPVLITSETVLKAIAYTNGFVDSAVNTAIYLIGSQGVATPAFSPPAGTYAAAQSVMISSATGGASIRYTTNGSTPSQTNGILYTGPVGVGSNLTLKAMAYATNLADSAVNTAAYTITHAAGTPIFTPAGGIFTNAQSGTITSATTDASIRYTIDSTAPSSVNGTLYSTPLTIASNTTLSAIAYAAGAADSAIATTTYTIAPPPAPPPTLAFEAELLSFVTNGAAAAVQTDVNSSGGKWIALEATAIGPWIDYTLPGIPAGTYHFKLMYKGNTGRGIISNLVDGLPLGGALDQYSANQTYPELELGIVALSAGDHIVRQVVVGKNPAAGSPWASADKFTLIQIPPPKIGNIQLQGTNLIISGTNSISNGTGYLVSSTNLSLPVTNWTRLATNNFDVLGDFSFTNRLDPTQPQRFYRVLLSR
jgi:hypothetical protein